jgi:RsiW-degrading membrane proteinase PrsW (M82 family)
LYEALRYNRIVVICISALAVAVPTFLYARLVRGIDRFEQEPVKYLIAAFVWGALPAALLALIVQLIFGLPLTVLLGEDASENIISIVLAPVSEELFKGLAVAALFFWRRREFDSWVDGIVYGSTVGFGFAYIENIIYLASAEDAEDWARLFFLRVIVFGFMHGFYTSLIGIGFGVARYASPVVGAIAIILGWAAAIVTHAIHNASVVLAEATEGGSLLITLANYGVLIALMIGLRVISRYNDYQMFRAYLADEVPEVITAQAYAALSGQRTQPPTKLSAQFRHLAGELAQRKRQRLKYNEHDHGEIDRLRAQLRALSYPSENRSI